MDFSSLKIDADTLSFASPLQPPPSFTRKRDRPEAKFSTTDQISTDQISTNLVFGYIRTQFNKLFAKRENIPPIINWICLQYFWEREYFTSHHPGLKLNETNDIVTCNFPLSTSRVFTIFGNILIGFDNNTLYEWKIKILYLDTSKYKNDNDIGIGIASHKAAVRGHFLDQCKPSYCYLSNGFIESSDGSTYLYGEKYKTNDTITMQLNLKRKMLKFYVNNKDQGIVKLKIDYKKLYYLAIALEHQNTSMQIFAFRTMYAK
eukprot:390670_1